MMTAHYVKNLKELIINNILEESLLDEAVLRILKLKEELGLFKNPYKVANIEKANKVLLCDEHKKAVRDVVKESMVLLKNNNILPFSKDKKIALIEPFARNKDLLGSWCWQGKIEETVSIEEGILNKISKENLLICEGCKINDNDKKVFEDDINIAKQADVILLTLGEESSMSGEGGSRAFITLPGVQEDLAMEIFKLNKPTAIILINGRPLEITNISKYAPDILESWFPSTEAGNVIADLIYGDSNPCGKLTMSFPYTVGQIPVYYNHYNTGRPKTTDEYLRYVSHFLDIPNEPLYPFGYGLSYTKFEYKDFILDKYEMTKKDVILAKVKVKNVGNREGKEAV